MRYDLTTALKDLNGKVVLDGGESVTYGKLLGICSLFQAPEDANLKAEDKLRRFRLAQKIAAKFEGMIDLEDSETVILRGIALKALTLVPYGQLMDFLDNPMPNPLSAVPGVNTIPTIVSGAEAG